MKDRTTKRRAALSAIALVGFLQAGCGIVSIPVPDKPNEPPPDHKELIRLFLLGRIELSDANNVTQRNIGVDNPKDDEGAENPKDEETTPIPRNSLRKQIASQLSEFSVSRPEIELSHVGWAWKSCLKARYRGSDVTIAFFMRSNRLLDARTNVQSDCIKQQYEASNLGPTR